MHLHEKKKEMSIAGISFCGADSRTCTGDLRVTNALLYQLSYIGRCIGLTACKGTALFETAKTLAIFFEIFLGTSFPQPRCPQAFQAGEPPFIGLHSGFWFQK